MAHFEGPFGKGPRRHARKRGPIRTSGRGNKKKVRGIHSPLNMASVRGGASRGSHRRRTR